MVYSSPVKRSALGSISSILNTTPKTPTRLDRVGKSATPRSTGIRQKIAHLFGANKENSPRKALKEDQWKEEIENVVEVPRRGQQIYHLLAAEQDLGTSKDESVQDESVKSPAVDVSGRVGETHAQPAQQTVRSRISPEALHIATLLSSRLRLAAYKVSTQQIHTPFAELASQPSTCTDTSVSLAIQRFHKSKKLQDQAQFFRTHRLSTICRRESRRVRRMQKSIHSSAMPRVKPPFTRQPSTITEEISSDQEACLPSPPDSQPAKTPLDELPSTPAPKRRIRRMKVAKNYDEYNGHLGLSSPPQQAYDPLENEGYYMEDMEMGDVPSSVLRGVEGLWALGFKA